MPRQHATSWNRRSFVKGLGLLAATLAVPDALTAALPDDPAPSKALRRLMRTVSQLVLPQTGTAGAGDVGVGDFVLLALSHGLERARDPLPANADPALQPRRADGSLHHAVWLENALNRRAGGHFLKRRSGEQQALLTALDAEAFAPGADRHPWRTIKALILTGYYTSETGGAQELRFDALPGRWDADIPLRPGDRAWSSDWSAVDFG